MTKPTMPNAGPQSALKADFLAKMREYYQRAGERDSYALLARLADAADDGAGQRELLALARMAVDALPTKH